MNGLTLDSEVHSLLRDIDVTLVISSMEATVVADRETTLETQRRETNSV